MISRKWQDQLIGIVELVLQPDFVTCGERALDAESPVLSNGHAGFGERY
jgi:hypothetical protein